MNGAAQQGLTIIELMIIVAIIGIIASVAIPAFQDYTVREKVREAVSLANPVRTALGLACSQGSLPGADNASLGLSAANDYSGDYTRGVEAAGLGPTEAIVTITLEAIGGVIGGGRKIVYTGTCGAAGMNWTIGGDVPSRYLPRT